MHHHRMGDAEPWEQIDEDRHADGASADTEQPREEAGHQTDSSKNENAEQEVIHSAVFPLPFPEYVLVEVMMETGRAASGGGHAVLVLVPHSAVSVLLKTLIVT